MIRRFVLLLLVAGCASKVKPPEAMAEGPAEVAVGSPVALDGSKSNDPSCEGRPASDRCTPRPIVHRWALKVVPPGSKAALNNPTLVKPSFIADEEGDYEVELIVSNGAFSSEPALVKVKATSCGKAPAIEEITSTPAAPGVGSQVQLAATVEDLDIDDAQCAERKQHIVYQWSIISQPTGSAARLNNPAAANPSFTADREGEYRVRLEARDSTGRAAEPKEAKVTVAACGGAPPSIADVTADPESPALGQIVSLAADASDPDNDPTGECRASQSLSYRWWFAALPVGSGATLNSETVESPSFRPDVAGDYVVRVVVTDSTGRASAPGTVTVTAAQCGGNAPSIEDVTATPAAPAAGSIVQLGADVEDADTSTLCGLTESFAFDWRIVALPAGSAAALNHAGAENPSFVADLPGEYVVRVVVRDASGLASAAFDATVTADVCGANPPVPAAAFEPASPITGDTILLTATVTDADNDPAGCALQQGVSYAWAFESLPRGSRAALNSFALRTPSFVADVPGDYVVRLAAADSTGRAASADPFTITVAACGSVAPAVAEFDVNGTAYDPADPGAVAVQVDTGETVQLSPDVSDGDADDADCAVARHRSFAWSIVSLPLGSRAALNDTSAENPSFTPDLPGPYVVRLFVTDAQGHVSAAADVQVEAGDCGSRPPTASIAPASPVGTVDSPVRLDASASDDPDLACAGGDRLSYAWSFVEAPAGANAVMADAALKTPSFTPNVAGVWRVRLVVTDAAGHRAQAEADVTVTACGANSPAATYTASSTAPSVTQRVDLTAAATDNDLTQCGATFAAAEFLSYRWWFVQAPAGSLAALGGAQTPRAWFVPDVPGTYRVALQVTDATGRTSPIVTEASITGGTAPIVAGSCGANTPAIASITASPASALTRVGEPVLLTPAVTDADNAAGCGSMAQALSYAWRFVTVPVGSAASLNDAQVEEPSFTPDAPGDYEVELVVIDSTGRAARATETVTIASCGHRAPSVTVLPSTAAPNTGATVLLTATPSDADAADGCEAAVYGYQWWFEQAPAGSAASLNQPGSRTPSFTPDVDGAYVIATGITDPAGHVGATVRTTVTAAACGANPPASLAVAQSPAAPVSGERVNLRGSFTDADSSCLSAPQTASYLWEFASVPSGFAGALEGATSLNPSFVGTVPGTDINATATFTLRFTVTDSTGRAATITHTVTVKTCGANAPAVTDITPTPATPVLGRSVQLAATSSDADVDTCALTQARTLRWWFASLPPGSRAGFFDPNVSAPSFVPDVAGIYRAAVQATDSTGRASAIYAEDLFNATQCGMNAPTPLIRVTGKCANVANDREFACQTTTAVGEPVQLDGSGSTDADNSAPCNLTQALSFDWDLLSMPAGSGVRLNPDANAQAPWVIFDVDGTYEFRVWVTDPTGLRSSAPARVKVCVDVGGASPPACPL